MAKKVNIKAKERKKSRAEAREEKKQRMIKIIIGAVTAFLMASSILMFAGGGSNNSYEYNKHQFIRKNNLWTTKINGKEIQFYNFPGTIANISIPKLIKSRILSSNYTIITFNPNCTNPMQQVMDLTRFDITNALFSMGVQVGQGITEKNPTYKNFNIITCNQSSTYIPIIELTEGNETGVFMNNSCIIIEAQTPMDMLTLRDRVLYELYGIIQ